MTTSSVGRPRWGGRRGRGRAAARAALPRLAVLLALAGPPAAAAQGSFSIGLGASAFDLSSSLVEGGSRNGIEFTFDYRTFTFSRLSLDLLATGSHRDFTTLPVASPSYPADTASFSLLAFGLRFDLLEPARSRWSPWVGVAPALATLQWRTWFQSASASALLLSLGADVELAGGLMLRGRLSTLQSSSAGGLSYRAASLSVVWEFFRPPHHRRPERWSSPPPAQGQVETPALPSQE